MSQLYISRSRILCSQTIDSQQSSVGEFWDNEPDDRILRSINEITVECALPAAGFMKQLLTSINPSLSTRNFSLFRASTVDYYRKMKRRNLFYIHFVFKPQYLMIQSMMSGQSMYTCVSISKDLFNRYTFTCESDAQEGKHADVVVSLQALLICISMYSPQNEIILSYNSNDRHIVLRGRCSNYDKYKHSSEVEQYLHCKLKTMEMLPLQIPFEDLDFTNNNKYDYFVISPKLLYPCFADVTTDSSCSKIILELLPAGDDNNYVLGMARENSTILVKWDYCFDKKIFDEFNISKPRLHKYATKCLQCVANGLKFSRKIKIMIKDNGALLVKTYMTGTSSDDIHVYYYVFPLVDAEC